jgi:cold shock CspA family protein
MPKPRFDDDEADGRHRRQRGKRRFRDVARHENERGTVCTLNVEKRLGFIRHAEMGDVFFVFERCTDLDCTAKLYGKHVMFDAEKSPRGGWRAVRVWRDESMRDKPVREAPPAKLRTTLKSFLRKDG